MNRKDKAGLQAQQTTTSHGDSEVKSNQEPAAQAQAAKVEPVSVDKENKEVNKKVKKKEEAAKDDQRKDVEPEKPQEEVKEENNKTEK